MVCWAHHFRVVLFLISLLRIFAESNSSSSSSPRRAAQWMSGNWGIGYRIQTNADGWNSYNVTAFINQLRSIGGNPGWIIVNLSGPAHGGDIYLSHHPLLWSLGNADATPEPGGRDLFRELLDGIHAEGLKVIAYMAGQGPCLLKLQDISNKRPWQESLQHAHDYNSTTKTSLSLERWRSYVNDTYGDPDENGWANCKKAYVHDILRYYAQLYGADIDGWWFDQGNYVDIPLLEAEVRAGNPNATLAINDGVKVPLQVNNAPYEDYTCGHPNPIARTSPSDPYNENMLLAVENTTDGFLSANDWDVLGHMFMPMGTSWNGINKVNIFLEWSEEQAVNWMSRMLVSGGAWTWNLPREDFWPPEKMSILREDFVDFMNIVTAQFTESVAPSMSAAPITAPSREPSISLQPSLHPSKVPSTSLSPSFARSVRPSLSVLPSYVPSLSPSRKQSETPSGIPSGKPTALSSNAPSETPSASVLSSNLPSLTPSVLPSEVPTLVPSQSALPSNTLTRVPSSVPSHAPSLIASVVPSTGSSSRPSAGPSRDSSIAPPLAPSLVPSARPSRAPSVALSTAPSPLPSILPSNSPSKERSSIPSPSPSSRPTQVASVPPSVAPTTDPSIWPSIYPSVRASGAPSDVPSAITSDVPSISLSPSRHPSATPSEIPSMESSIQPSITPSISPSRFPSLLASAFPSLNPTMSVLPTIGHSLSPSNTPTVEPSNIPTTFPTDNPSRAQSIAPSPSDQPTVSESQVLDCESNEILFQVLIVTDQYPIETDWKLANFAGIIFKTGGPYDLPNTEYITGFCVPDNDAYVFTIKDRYGDGLCCENGEGSYSIMLDGAEDSSGGQFLESESINIVPECDSGKARVIVQITTDFFGYETSWSIDTTAGATIMGGGNYKSWETSKVVKCLDASECYTFTIRDSWGDGMCCSYGLGGYAVEFLDTTYDGSFFQGEQEIIYLGQSCPSSNVASATARVNRSRQHKRHGVQEILLRESLYKQAHQTESDKINQKNIDKPTEPISMDEAEIAEDDHSAPNINNKDSKPEESQLIGNLIFWNSLTRKRRGYDKNYVGDADDGVVAARIDDQTGEPPDSIGNFVLDPIRKRKHGQE